MTRKSIQTEPDVPPQWSAILILAAVMTGAASLLLPGPANGMTLVAGILLILSIARRVTEYNRRTLAATHERQNP